MNIKEELQKVFREVFFDDSIVITESTTADDIEEWDSLSHITLIQMIEGRFNITFTTEEILGAKNVGEFIGYIEKKLK
jgi:acyl carrier protein